MTEIKNTIEILKNTIEDALKSRPQVGGFPVLAEYLRKAGVLKNRWTLPFAQAIYITSFGNVVLQGPPIITETEAIIPEFNKAALIKVLRTDQAGKSTFPEFLHGAWLAGVVGYSVDFTQRVVHYYGINDEVYTESYPAVEIE